MGRWMSPDIIALSVPVAGGFVLFSNMIRRAFMVDPEWSNGMEFYENPDKAEKLGTTYRTQYRQFFPNTGTASMSWLFNNDGAVKN